MWANFLEAISTGDRPGSDIEIGHRPTNLALLDILSYKLGRSLEGDGEKELILNDSEANGLLRRAYRSSWQYPVA